MAHNVGRIKSIGKMLIEIVYVTNKYLYVLNVHQYRFLILKSSRVSETHFGSLDPMCSGILNRELPGKGV